MHRLRNYDWHICKHSINADLPTVPLLAGQSRFFLPDVPRPAKSWKCPAFCTKSDFFFARGQFVKLPRCPITQLNVITKIPFDFSQKYHTVPRPNRRATVYFGTQLISVGCILLKKIQCGPCQPSRFLPASPAFLREMSL